MNTHISDDNAQSQPEVPASVDSESAVRGAETESAAASASVVLESSGLWRGDGHVGLRRVLTYGTFDLLHYGHVRLLQRAAALGDYLIVALSTDEFNLEKGKRSFYPYEVRREMLEALRYVDLVVPERGWGQKLDDVREYRVDVVCMGGDWRGSPRFEFLRDVCDVVYLDRTDGISTTDVKHRLSGDDKHQ